MALGKKIRALREELKMSQAELAAAARLSQGYLSQLENDDVRHPSAAVLFRLAEALHVDPRALMRAAGYEQPQSAANRGSDEFDATVDPDLLRLLSRIPREQHTDLLRFLRGLENGSPSDDEGAPEVASPPGRPAG